MKKVNLLPFVLLFFVVSCREPTVFREYQKIENMTWSRFDVLEFEVPVNEGDKLDFDLALRHHTNFPYEKLFVNITFNAPDGEMRAADYAFLLKDDAGKWLADGMGELWDIVIPIRKEMPFYQTGICTVKIGNNYSKFETPGIIEVGLLVKKSVE